MMTVAVSPGLSSGDLQAAGVGGVEFNVRDGDGALAAVEHHADAEALREGVVGAHEALRGPASVGLGVVEKADFRQGHVVNAYAVQADCGVQHLFESNQHVAAHVGREVNTLLHPAVADTGDAGAVRGAQGVVGDGMRTGEDLPRVTAVG